MKPTLALPLIGVGIAPKINGKGLRFRPNYTAEKVTAPEVRPGPKLDKPKEVPALPPKTVMAKNAAKSILANAKAIALGKQLNVEDDEAKRRLDICRSCEFFRPTDERCSKCGCFLAAKAYLKLEKCPVGKWD